MAAAFAAVFLLWGSTYLAIKYAIETLPPFLMAGSRFLFAGTVLFLIATRTSDFEMPKAAHWRTSIIAGTLLLLIGNGGVVIAQHYISSSLAALLVATEPFWIVVLSWLWLKNSRPDRRVTLGLIVGFIGVAMLITGQPIDGGFLNGGFYQWAGTFAVIIAAFGWAVGSIYGLKAPVPKSALLTAGMQMISGGAALLIVSLVRGEWSSFDIAAVSGRSAFAFAYLLVFGSLIGFTSYSWLLRNVRPSTVATYAYVNPVVAVILGWGFAGESMTGLMLAGAAIVLASVALVTGQGSSPAEERLEAPEQHRSQTPSCREPGYSVVS